VARLSILATGLALLLIVLIGAVVTAVTSPFGGSEGAWCLQPAPGTDPDADPAGPGLDDEQADNAQVIITVGHQMGVSPRGWVIAIATALQESRLHNLPHLGADNDHDSLGLFQQRPSQGWGTPEQISDPVHASTAFYERLLQVEGWQELPLTQAAQQVQRSAFPNAYTRHETQATRIVAAVASANGWAIPEDLEQCVSTDGWTRPVPGLVWSGFRTVARPDHYGIDIGAPRGTEIRAAADGVVTLVACNATLDGAPYSCDVDGSPEVAGCGWYVNLRHGEVVTRYCHQLTRPEVTVGETVVAGQPIGLVGSSGRSSGPHLHFEVEIAPEGGPARVTDPIAFMAARGVEFECGGAPIDCQPTYGDREVG
jgi:murein DD-endopeptidase MepM/ murein hydrolase activator NlpD